MEGYSKSPQEERIEILKSLMPEIFDEGKIDFEKLKATLGEDVNFSNERYVLNWAGKSEAFRIMQRPSSSTLVPSRGESVDFDTTQNIFIEGENMEVLKVLQKSYFGKVKMIYIDPPYNTGNDSFIYPDKFSESKEEYQKRVGDKDNEGYMTREGMFHKNSRENGQYHSNWLNMMMPRLYLAKSLLREDGVIFISIDDNEVHNLRLLMNEIFGEENLLGQIIVKNNPRGRQSDTFFATVHEYLICYAKQIDYCQLGGIMLTEEQRAEYKFEDNYGKYRLLGLRQRGVASLRSDRPDMYFPIYVNQETLEIDFIQHMDWKCVYPHKSDGREGRWMWGMQKCERDKHLLVAKKIAKRNEYDIFVKDYLNKNSTEERTRKLNTILDNKEINNQVGTQEVKAILGGEYMSFPKSMAYIKLVCSLIMEKDSIILDFFAGSGTTAHAVMQLNKEDSGNRQFICVQMAEPCDPKSEAYKAGYSNIAEISKERIRRAGAKLCAEVEAERNKKENELSFEETEQTHMPDFGFKVFRLSGSNFKQWRDIRGSEQEQWQQQSLDFINPVAENATIDNMVYELLLKNGKNLNSTIVHSNNIYNINSGELVLLLETADQETVDHVISLHPQKVIALDNLFSGNDQLKTNTALQLRDAGIEFKTI
jgi:adenine-specific DNA-methyltransferase